MTNYAPAPAGTVNATANVGRTILQVGPVNPDVQAALTGEFGALRLPDAPAEHDAFLEAHAGEIQVAVCSGRFGVGTA